jgi:aldose 1-epimerase
VLVLNSGGTCVMIEPASGGMIERCRMQIQGVPAEILHAPPERPHKGGFPWFGCWPLAPFANRAFGGIVQTPDGPVQLPVNDPESGNAMHGFAAQSEWAVSEQGEAHAVLEHNRNAAADPFAYRARQHIRIEPLGAVLIAICIENRSERRMPFGLGLHPWFPCDDDTTLTAGAATVVEFGPGYRPLGAKPVDETTDWRRARRVSGGQNVANFLDWDGSAELSYPSRGYTLRIEASDTLRHALLWSPGDEGFVCFEPQSHVIGAISDPAGARLSPMALLGKGESFGGWMRLSARMSA